MNCIVLSLSVYDDAFSKEEYEDDMSLFEEFTSI
jgi:hypothetical protein